MSDRTGSSHTPRQGQTFSSIGMLLAGAKGIRCAKAAFLLAALLPFRAAVGEEAVAHSTSTIERKVSIIYAEATGSFIVLLAVAQQQGFFKKFGVDVQSIAARGAVVPRLTTETPIGMIGEPAALLQAADGAELRIVASFSNINLSGHLVARPEIKNWEGLRGKRIGVRVLGAGLWISAILCFGTIGIGSSARRHHDGTNG